MRPATAQDVPALVALLGTGTTEWSDRQVARFCQPAAPGQVAEQRGLVVEQAGEVLACILVARVLDEAEIINVAVAAAERRQGHGRRLLQVTLAELDVQGVTRCHLEVRASNVPAIDLYRSEGFVPCGRRAGYYPLPDGATEDALLMSKTLPGTGS